jgi:hypothetical protein
MFIVPKVPNSPGCYANAHSDRINKFKALIHADNQSQDDMWRHELDHDVESVFWLLLYWAMVAQPEGSRGEYIDLSSWTRLLGNFEKREDFISSLGSGRLTDLTHSLYAPLWPLIRDLAAILVVDRHWLPESDVRKCPEYICEAFQRLILQFIISHRDEDFMTRRVGDSLRQVPSILQP